MNLTPSNAPRWRPLIEASAAVMFAFIIFAMFSIYDEVEREHGAFQEGTPLFTPYYLVRLLACVAMSGIVLWPIWRAARLDMAAELKSVPPAEIAMAWGANLLALLFLVVFLVDARLFSALLNENGPVEMATALALLLAALLLVGLMRRLARIDGGRLLSVVVAIYALFMFILCMEEISWGQQFLSFQTPEILSGNAQGEANLHNFATDEFELVFYTLSYGFLVYLPQLAAASRMLANNTLAIFVPRLGVVFAVAPMAAFNYDMWNIIPIQMSFWTTVLTLLLCLNQSLLRATAQTSMIVFALGVVSACQLSFIAFGDSFVRAWDVTEYREFCIAIGLLVYALQVRRGAKRYL